MGVVSNGLIAYWHYKQGASGTTWQNIAPTTIGSYDATLSGSFAIQSDGVHFDSGTGKATIASFPAETAYTVEIGFKMETQWGQTRYIFNAGSASSFIIGLQNSSYNPGIYDGGWTYTTGAQINQLNTQYNFVVQNGGTTTQANFFVNGVAKANNASSVINNGWETGAITFGSLSLGATGAFFKGTIQFIRIYNRKLTSTEISQNYAVGADTVGLDAIVVKSYDTKQAIYNMSTSNRDTLQKVYKNVLFSEDTLQHFVDAAPQSTTSVQDAIKIYNASNGSLISNQGILDNPIQFTLNISKNESKEQRLYVQSKVGYTLSDVIISFFGNTSNRWQLSLDVNGSPNNYLNPLSSLNIGTVGGVAGQKVYFWVKASSDNTEILGNDSSVILSVSGMASVF